MRLQHAVLLLLLLVLGTFAALRFIPRRTGAGAGVEQRPDSVNAAVAQGDSLLLSGSLRDAGRAYTTALRMASDRAARHAIVGNVREFLGRDDSLPGTPLQHAELAASLWLTVARMGGGDSEAARQGLRFYTQQAGAFDTAAHWQRLATEAEGLLPVLRDAPFVVDCRARALTMLREFGHGLAPDEVTWLTRALATCRATWPDEPRIAYLQALSLLHDAERAQGTRVARELLAEAQSLAAGFVARHPGSAAAHVYRADVAFRCLLTTGRTFASEEVLAELASLQERVTPDVEPAVGVLFARLLAAADCRSASTADATALLGVRRALSFLHDLSRVHPTNRAVKLELAYLLGQDGQRERAAAELDALTVVLSRLCPETVQHAAVQSWAHVGRMLASVSWPMGSGTEAGHAPPPFPADAWEAVSRQPLPAPVLETIKGLQALRAGESRSAASLLVKANQGLGGRDPTALLGAGLALLECHEYGASADLLGRAVRCPRLVGRDRLRAGMALAQAGLRVHDAELAFPLTRRIRELVPRDRRALFLAAEAMATRHEARRRSIDDADASVLADLEAGLVRRAAQGDLAAVHWLSRVLRIAGRSPQALSLLRVHAGTSPSDPDVLVPLLELEAGVSTGTGAAERLRRAIAVLRDTPARDVLAEWGSGIPPASLLGLAHLDSDLDICLGLTDLFQRNGRSARADGALRRAAALAPTDARVLSRQVHRAFAAGETTLASALIDRGREAGVPPLLVQLWGGAYHAAIGDFSQAGALLQEAVDEWPLCSLAWALLAETHRLADDRLETERLFREAARIKPDSLTSSERLFRLYARLDESGRALKVLEEGRVASGEPERVVGSYLAYLTSHQRLSDVLTERERCAGTYPGDHANRRAVALIKARRGEHAEALALLQALAQEDRRSAANVLALAEQHARVGAPDEGRRVLDAFLDELGEDATAGDWRHLARYCRTVGDVDRATAAYREAVRRQAGPMQPATMELADFHMNRGRAGEALPVLRELAAAGTSPRAWRRYVEALALAGQAGEARREMEANGERQADATGNLLLRARVGLTEGEHEEALAALDRFIAQQPTEPAGYLFRAYTVYKMGAFLTDERGRDDLVAGLRVAPELSWPRELVACWAILMNQPVKAIRQLEVLLAGEPTAFASRAVLARLYLATRQLQAMDTLLKSVPSETGDLVRWHRLRARLLLAKGQPAEASRELAAVFGREPAPRNLQDHVVGLLVCRRPEEALRALRDHEDLTGAAPALLAVRGTVLARLGRKDEARETFAAGLKLAGSEQAAALGVARQLCVALGLEDAFSVLGGAVPSAALRGYLEGCCLMACGGLARGLERLRQVREDLPEDNPLLTDVLHQLAHAYTLNGEYLRAHPLYDTLIVREPRRSTYYRKLVSMVESGKLADLAQDLGGNETPPFTWESGDSLFQIVPGWLADFSGERVLLFERIEARFAEVWHTRPVPVASRCIAEVLSSQDDLDRTLTRSLR